jgi:hypothetical protein
VVSGITPTGGPVGTMVVITGTGLLKTSRVTFYNQIAATSFTVDSDTQVSVTVPSAATTGPIQVTTSGGTATSSQSFTVN